MFIVECLSLHDKLLQICLKRASARSYTVSSTFVLRLATHQVMETWVFASWGGNFPALSKNNQGPAIFPVCQLKADIRQRFSSTLSSSFLTRLSHEQVFYRAWCFGLGCFWCGGGFGGTYQQVKARVCGSASSCTITCNAVAVGKTAELTNDSLRGNSHRRWRWRRQYAVSVYATAGQKFRVKAEPLGGSFKEFSCHISGKI